MTDRYIVTELEGFDGMNMDSKARTSTTCYVLDRAYCHRIVFRVSDAELPRRHRLTRHDDYMTPWERRERVRGLARARAMELNAAAA